MSVVGGIMTQAALLRPIAAVQQKRVRFVLPITDEPRRAPNHRARPSDAASAHAYLYKKGGAPRCA